MINIQRSNYIIPQSLLSDQCISHLKKIISSRGIEKAREFYKAEDIKETLLKIYNNKCAYCEDYLNGFDIDHYRPKGAVNEAGNNQEGYYWLSYEWTNLLPSCIECNQRRKRARFPVSGTRAACPMTITNYAAIEENHLLSKHLQSESPQLLHPEIHIIEDHLFLDNNVDFQAKTIEGEKTIQILFGRGRFKVQKQAIITRYYKYLLAICEYYQDNQNDHNVTYKYVLLTYKCFLKETNDVSETFLQFKRHILKNFDIVIDFLDKSIEGKHPKFVQLLRNACIEFSK